MKEQIKELIAEYTRAIEILTDEGNTDRALCNSFIVGKINGLCKAVNDLTEILEGEEE